MNLRCIYCQTPFTLARAEMLDAIVTMNEKSQTHYDAHCPRCRRANSISRQRMELFFPNWQDAAKQAAAEAKAEAMPASAAAKTEPLPKAAKTKSAERKTPAKPAKAPAAKKPTTKAAEKKVAAKGKKK